jgi:hypothetical protein
MLLRASIRYYTMSTVRFSDKQTLRSYKRVFISEHNVRLRNADGTKKRGAIFLFNDM